MSDFDNQAACAAELSDSDKIRGRIPKHAWGYVRGQYELKNRTYEEIGKEFNCTPSAVFYVVKQATLREIEATLELPADETAKAEINRIMAKSKATTSWTARQGTPVQSVAPKAPSQVELMAQQANAMLEDEHCKRLFDATSKTIVDYVGFKAAPDDDAKKAFKDALHELRRSIASIELKVEMMPAQAPAAAPVATAPVAANTSQRLPEMA